MIGRASHSLFNILSTTTHSTLKPINQDDLYLEKKLCNHRIRDIWIELPDPCKDMRSFRRESSDITHRVEQSLKLAAIGAAYDEGKSSSNEKERSEVTCCPGIWSKNAKKPQVKK
ncbi:hypothetical protein ABG067_004593 [Albugo candida]